MKLNFAAVLLLLSATATMSQEPPAPPKLLLDSRGIKNKAKGIEAVEFWNILGDGKRALAVFSSIGRKTDGSSWGVAWCDPKQMEPPEIQGPFDFEKPIVPVEMVGGGAARPAAVKMWCYNFFLQGDALYAGPGMAGEEAQWMETGREIYIFTKGQAELGKRYFNCDISRFGGILDGKGYALTARPFNLQSLDFTAGHAETFSLFREKSPQTPHIVLADERRKCLWLMTRTHLFRFVPGTKQIEPIPWEGFIKLMESKIPKDSIRMSLHAGKLFVTCGAGTAISYDPETGKGALLRGTIPGIEADGGASAKFPAGCSSLIYKGYLMGGIEKGAAPGQDVLVVRSEGGKMPLRIPRACFKEMRDSMELRDMEISGKDLFVAMRHQVYLIRME